MGKLIDIIHDIGAGRIIIGALVIALAVTMWRADQISGQRDKARQALAVSEANHAVTRASLTALQRELSAMVAEGRLTTERLAQAARRQQSASAALRGKAWRIIAEGADEPCLIPPAVLDARGL